MADYEYFGNATFQTLLEQRDHEDKFVSEVIRTMGAMNGDFGEILVHEILKGNTHTLSKFYRKSVDTPYKVQIVDGTFLDDRIPHPELDVPLYPMVPIKDDYTDFMGVASYADLPEDDPLRMDVDENLSALNMDWEEIANDIVDPEPITGGVDDPSFVDYKRQWENSESLQEQYPTLQQYYDQVVQDQQDMFTHIGDISDIQIGIGSTGDYLGEANVTAIYHTFTKILPLLTFTDYGKPSGGSTDFGPYPQLAYAFEYTSLHFKVVCGMTEWSHIIRYGTVRDEWDPDGEEPKWSKGKCNHTFYEGTTDAQKNHDDGDPIYQIVRPNPEDGTFGGGAFNNHFTGMIEMHVQLPDLDDGTHVYGEIRMWDYGTMHVITNSQDDHITVITGTIEFSSNSGTDPVEDQSFDVNDGEANVGIVTVPSDYQLPHFEFNSGGDEGAFTIDSMTGEITAINPLDYATQNVYYLSVNVADEEGREDNFYVTVNVLNTNSEPEPPPHDNPFGDDIEEAEHHGSDLIFFPINPDAVREVEVFKRERLLRESVLMNVYTVHIEKIEWYQKGWFKAVMFILAIVLAALGQPEGLALLLSAEFVVTTAIQLVFATIVVQMIVNMVGEEAWLALAVVAFAAIAMGVVNVSMPTNFDSFIALATKFMQAANIAIKGYYQRAMEKLQEEMLEWQEKMEAAEKELDQLAEEAGGLIRSDASDLTRWLASTPEPEDADTFFDRTQDLYGNAIIDDVGRYVDPYNMFPPMINKG